MRHHVAIEITGICPAGSTTPWRWCGYQPLSPTASTRANALLSIGQISASVAEGEAVAQSGVTAIVLNMDDMTAYGTRPIDIFGVVGAENLSATQVWSTRSVAAGDTSVTIETGPTFSSGQVLHIGSEMMTATAARTSTGSQSVTVTRGQGGSLASPHRAALSGFFARTIPVTSVPCVWIGRRVNIYVDEALWRSGYLVDNPQINGNQIVLQYVSAENLLSSERSGDYIPTYATTLAPTTSDASWHNRWAGNFYSIPEMVLDIPYSKASHLTKAQALDNYAGYNTIQSPAGTKLQCMWWHYDGEDLGVNDTPRVFVTWSRGVVNLEAGDTGESSYTLEAATNAYQEFGGSFITLDWQYYTWQESYKAMDECVDTHSNLWTLSSVRTSAYTSTGYAQSIAYPGAQSYTWGITYPYAYDYDEDEPFAWQLQQTSVLVHNCMSSGAGYPLKHDPTYFGIMWRHNVVGPYEANATNGNLYAPLPVCNVWYSTMESQIRPCPVDRLYKRGDLYPVRPKQNGDVHNSYTINGCGLVFDAYLMLYTDTDGTIPCDVATAYWEVGTNTICTLELIPGISTDWAPIAISWVEPDGTEFSATAEVKRASSSDYSTYYGYRIRSVTLTNGNQCVGFGTWPGQGPCQITRPVSTTGRLGEIACRIISSGDGTSGRQYDNLGDGLGCPITGYGALSIYQMSVGLAMSWQYDPTQTSYGDYLRTAALCSGKMLVGAIDSGGYGPHAVPAGRPILGEQVAVWTDGDIVGLPSSSSDSGLVYTGYHVKTKWEEYTIPDWLAADLFGQSNECEIDLTGLTGSSLVARTIVKGLANYIVDSLRDRFGSTRRHWSLEVPIDIGLQRCVGDVVAITSEHLIAPDGTVGVSGYLARIMSISHDLMTGRCHVELVAYGAYDAGYAPCWDVTLASVSGTTYTFNFVTSSDPVVAQRQIYDRMHFSPTSGTHYVVGITGQGSSGYMYGNITSWSPTEAGGQCVLSRSNYYNPLPAVGDRMLIMGYSSTQYPTAYQFGVSRLGG